MLRSIHRAQKEASSNFDRGLAMRNKYEETLTALTAAQERLAEMEAAVEEQGRRMEIMEQSGAEAHTHCPAADGIQSPVPTDRPAPCVPQVG